MTLIARLSALLIKGHFGALSLIFDQCCLRRIYLNTTLCSEIVDKAKMVEEKIREHLKVRGHMWWQ